MFWTKQDAQGLGFLLWSAVGRCNRTGDGSPISFSSLSFYAAVVGFAVAHRLHDALPQSPLGRPAFWALLSLADHGTVSEAKTGFSFLAFLEDGRRRLLGTGVRRKSIMGLKNIDVYAFGVYADDKMTKKVWAGKYGKLSVSELKDSTDLSEDVLDQDLGMTVRLQIVYGRLSIRSVRSAFEESIGSRLKKFGGPYNDELLQRCLNVEIIL